MSATAIAIAGLIVAAIFGGVVWLIKGSLGRAKDAGKTEIIHEAREDLIDDIQLAKRTREAMARDTDAEWARRVRDKYRRD